MRSGAHVANCLDDREALGVSRPAKRRVSAVEVGHSLKANEELASRRIWIARAGHREHARLMRRRVELRGDRVTRSASARPLRAAPLDHESFDDAVK